ncbi:recombination mediator RecR [Chitinophagales bacterium]|jgi:recombination protein RecR|nr:recombination mediator RecR [Chitinophagales bacterium]
MNYPSKLIAEAVAEFKRLPGIGEKTALRLVLHLLKQDEAKVARFSQAVEEMRNNIQTCRSCHNYSDEELCSVCSNPNRDVAVVCVVENIRDVIAIENTGTFRGLYHVLGGIISPVNGVGPDDLQIDSLLERIAKEGVEEVIMAISPTMEGDTTIYYISKVLQAHKVKLTTIARGISFGGELEYTDELTLARSLASRMPYENYLVK